MKKYFYCLILFIVVINPVVAQKDSLKVESSGNKTFLSKQILPLSLITAGSLLNIGTVKNKIEDQIPNTNTHIENYMQYTGMAEIYLFDAMGFRHQNSVFDQTKYLAISQLITSTVVTVLKRTTRVARPYGARSSFPSGHTTMAFTGATALFQEFKNTDPLIACSGFAFSTATGFLRLTNRAHWLPDVMVGAGIGILTVDLVYHFKPLKNFQPFKKKNNVSIIPEISPESLGFVCRF